MRFIVFLLFLSISSISFGQSEALAKNYFDQGAFDKALPIYEKLHQNNPNRLDYLLSLVVTHQQLENYTQAEVLLKKGTQLAKNSPTLWIELGRNYQLQKDTLNANLYYKQALNSIEERPNLAHTIATAFSKYNLLEEAVLAYEIGMAANPQLDFNMPLARIYGEQGKLEKMFESYLNSIEKNPGIAITAQRYFENYITENPENEANEIFRKTILKKSQANPDILYNELLSWLFVQQKQYDRAFVQQKAIFKRTMENQQGLIDLAMITIEEKEYTIAKEVLHFIIENATTDQLRVEAYQNILLIDTSIAEKKEYESIKTKYENLFSLYGKGTLTFGLQLDYNHFIAFQLEQKELAIENLKNLIKEKLSRYQEAKAIMKLADILVFDEKFNEALIHYSQIQSKVKNDPIAQEARFKVARTSYFKGDFIWAQTQLDILKKSTSQLIANDAMELSLLISDNSLEDSTQTALKLYSKADLLALQNKNQEAINVLNTILKNHKDESIEDEALYKQALVFEKTKQFNNAIANYLQIIEFHSQDILADNAYFNLAELYNKTLQQPEKAKEFYEQIIFNHQDSIYFVEARKQFRSIRGDALN
ncbi:MAG: hypothetical protein COZ75_10505 [Flavobacteriaceae bacterium CG_4_8_14_3_um_filter_34_10]|nr:tetratricopeptide repeat protein [Flavobacteriia bacterium]OIP49606.1 MAG: hypothetical protein AUK33_10055 [Flavobacteriaceae bacterium CG2_30_34_30]PIQ18347.1 MAG: hypothetical protein COW66_06855 [Flavobacteriaceae bacterium CG18_big_fil_WC_8_21_14_2_50_34_36]PIV49736.1 MAG: hypothetical protein COS19_07025 [Flavobacteriaceae bacterium CG02_land_8_20_14_3_00_34_13]PIX08719.1 MAG: hypothetical protein COZ75_10505 [Flavobacteriaceae bacterium CG_4_8_14_3_um_filter_34_10]PIZ08742.1 MAG: hyp